MCVDLATCAYVCVRMRVMCVRVSVYVFAGVFVCVVGGLCVCSVVRVWLCVCVC